LAFVRQLSQGDLGDHDLEHTLNLVVSRIRGGEQHHNPLRGVIAKRDLEPIPGQVCTSDPE
jgi:hypothetical protein